MAFKVERTWFKPTLKYSFKGSVDSGGRRPQPATSWKASRREPGIRAQLVELVAGPGVSASESSRIEGREWILRSTGFPYAR